MWISLQTRGIWVKGSLWLSGWAGCQQLPSFKVKVYYSIPECDTDAVSSVCGRSLGPEGQTGNRNPRSRLVRFMDGGLTWKWEHKHCLFSVLGSRSDMYYEGALKMMLLDPLCIDSIPAIKPLLFLPSIDMTKSTNTNKIHKIWWRIHHILS